MENEILKEIRNLKAFQEKKFDEMDSKIQKLDEKVDKIDKKVDKLDEKVNQLDEKVNQLDEKVNQLDEKVNQLDEKIDRVEREIINEYKSFVDTVDTVNKKQIKDIREEVIKNTNDLNKYKEKVKQGIGLFEKAVG